MYQTKHRWRLQTSDVRKCGHRNDPDPFRLFFDGGFFQALAGCFVAPLRNGPAFWSSLSATLIVSI
jgi:hypothetical protein